jgi:hypothetical protein
MLSFGSAAYTGGKELIGTFSANLETLPGETAMRRYVLWLKALPGKPVFVGYPAGFNFLFDYWYLIRFAGESPFSFFALDIKITERLRRASVP